MNLIEIDAAKSFIIPLIWRPVLVEGEVYPWHRKPQKYLKYRELIEGPRVYRWVFKSKADEIEAVYIGESEKFEKRLAGYRKPTKTNPKDTNVIVNKRFARCEEIRGTVELQFLEFDEFVVNGQRIDAQVQSLANHEIRLLLECIAIVTAKSEKPELLNRLSENASAKEIKRVFKKSSSEQQSKILEILQNEQIEKVR